MSNCQEPVCIRLREIIRAMLSEHSEAMSCLRDEGGCEPWEYAEQEQLILEAQLLVGGD